MAKKTKTDRSPHAPPPPAGTSGPPAQKSALELILEWSSQRPEWQRDALRRIVSKGALSDADIQELVALCKRDHGDASCKLPPNPLAATHLPAGSASTAAVALTAISDVVGVNQLAPAQSLVFGSSGLTIVYGDNGAGKSGYARILKRACRARRPGDIARDAFDPNAPEPSSTIAYTAAGATQTPVVWRNEDQPHPILSSISVFDEASGTVHVEAKNEVAFRPFGLDVPDELAAACQGVKDALTKEQSDLERQRDTVFSTPNWKPTTQCGKILSSLTHETDLAPLDQLAVVSDAERARHQQLVEDLAKDPIKAAREQDVYADELRTLTAQLAQLAAQNSDHELNALITRADTAQARRTAVDEAATKAFNAADLAGVGSATWQALWAAARRYASEAAYIGKPFPIAGDVALCVLCHQTLDTEARSRLQGFEEFVSADLERQARDAEDAYTAARRQFEGRRLNTSSFNAIRKRIAIANTALDKAVLRFLASARIRRRICERRANGEKALVLPALVPYPTAGLQELETKTRAYAAQLRQAAQAEGRRKLEAERDELADRIALTSLLPKARLEVQRLKKLHLISKAIPATSTQQITKLGNDIADHVITPQLRDRFQSEIVALAANRVRVEIVRSGGRFGSPQYQVRFFANPSARVHEVLSEGEQTCVALAAFLAELATAPTKSALVFDDPVTSLDHRWRKRVAQRLVKEAASRQVIVFTHDLVFVHDLKDSADAHDTPVKVSTVARAPAGAGVVADGLPWRGTGIKDRVDKLEKEVREAKKFHDAHDEDEYRNRVFKIYNGLRSTWERAIEDTAFNGVVVRHRDYVNTKNLRKVTVLTEADCDAFDAGFKKCCDQTDAHDPSRARSDEPPSPDEVLQDVQAVGNWTAAIRARQNRVH